VLLLQSEGRNIETLKAEDKAKDGKYSSFPVKSVSHRSRSSHHAG